MGTPSVMSISQITNVLKVTFEQFPFLEMVVHTGSCPSPVFAAAAAPGPDAAPAAAVGVAAAPAVVTNKGGSGSAHYSRHPT